MSEEEKEEEPPLFIPNQQDILEKLAKEEERLRALVAQQQRQNQNLKLQYEMLQGSRQGYFLYVEQFRARRQPVWWFLATLLSVICVFGCYDKGKWVALALNIVGHKLLWRRLYVETNSAPQTMALGIVLYTLLFV